MTTLHMNNTPCYYRCYYREYIKGNIRGNMKGNILPLHTITPNTHTTHHTYYT